MKSLCLTPIAIASLLVTSFANGQTVPLQEVRIVASPIIESNNVDAFGSLSTKVTDAQIRDLGALDLAAGLRMTPGVQISRYNEVGSYSGDQGGNVYVRGLGTSRPGSEIKTYLDGVPVYMGIWNHPLIDLLPLNGVRSVNILKGPQPQSNSNTLASINLQTRRATQNGFGGEATVSAGSFGTRTLQANLMGKNDNLDVMVSAGQVNSSGDRTNSDGSLSNGMGRIGLAINNSWSAAVSFLSVNNQVGDPGDNRFATSTAGVGPYSFSNGVGRNTSSVNMVALSLAHKHGDASGELQVYDSQGNNDLTNDANWGTFKSAFKMSGFKWREELSPWTNGRLLASLDRESISGSVSGPHVGSPVGTPFAFGTAGSADIPTFTIASAYAGISHSFALSQTWTVQPSAGVRQYNSNFYESKSSPHLGLALKSEDLEFYLNSSVGILYPGAETYTLTRAIPMAFAANNGWDRLAPTESRHNEVGMRWDAAASTHIDVSIFSDEVSNRYVWSGFNAGAFAPPASGTWSNNYPTYRIQGSEVSVRHDINRQWSVFAGVTTLDPSIANLPYAPKTAYSAGVTGAIGGFHMSLDAQSQDSMYTLTQDRGTFTPNLVPGLTVANARVAYQLPVLGKKGEVFAALNNLADASYQYNAGYPMPGRNFRVGLTASF